MVDYLERRLKKVRTELSRQRLDAVLLTDVRNVRYLSNFSGDDSWLVVTSRDAALLTDSRYIEQARAECRHCEIVERAGSLSQACRKQLNSRRLHRAGFEADSLTWSTWQALHDDSIEWQPTSGLVEKLRRVKDPNEIRNIKRAVAVAEECFRRATAGIRPGVTEVDVANEIEITLRRLGGDCSSFDTIVLFGERCSLPHGRPGRRVLKPGEPVLIDWGVRVGEYVSDLTRTLLPSTMNSRLEAVYQAVLAAQQAAIRAARGGVAARSVDMAARRSLKRRGLDVHFRHGLGHGVGMCVHEGPVLSRHSSEKLRTGMVVTIEPGVYIPGWGGVRIEDMVQITGGGCKVLTSLPKQLKDVCVL